MSRVGGDLLLKQSVDNSAEQALPLYGWIGRDFRSEGARDTRLPPFMRIFDEIFTMTHLVMLLLGSLGTTEIILILLIVVLMFGGRKIPELMRGLGKGIREFNDAKNNVKREIEDGIKEDQNDRNPR
jgi:sec-independent protein translocase protein TatA